MARYFAELTYKGTNYKGWQVQPAQPSIQGTIEEALTTILEQSVEVVGCGRTDTGVHAMQYFLHFDFEKDFPPGLLMRINKYLPTDIAIRSFIPVAEDAHTRFDATHRAYEYHITFRKDPFLTETAYLFPFVNRLEPKMLNEAASLLKTYQAFYPFCKSNTDVKTMNCKLSHAEWDLSDPDKGLVFHIGADRFLRGMVRLIVGMCLNVAMGKVNLSEVKRALEMQERLDRSWSVPPEGLFLKDIRYPYI